jgi:CDP-paratose 2-epimerase
MKKNKLLVTGSCGLVGSEIINLLSKDYKVIYGIDNNSRKVFFGSGGDITTRKKSLKKHIKNYHHYNFDIRNRGKISNLIKKIKPDCIIHCAGQPSHDLAAKIPYDDFDTNAVGTLNLLESTRKYCKKTIFIFLSTNKVYGDAPNKIKISERDKRFIISEKKYLDGIPETFNIDQNTHSIFGASKLAADVMVQEYGRYFNLKTCCIRAGCITGPHHSGVELHGYLNYLVKMNIERKKYTVFGYKGKQVRDNIHAKDLVMFIKNFIKKPRVGEVYNIGGGYKNSISILEAFELVEKASGIKMIYKTVKKNRIGDHICYYSNLKKAKKHYPEWSIKINLKTIIKEIIQKYKKNV